PTPRKPPKSIAAARTVPVRSTITSTIRPMSSSVGLRTSRPSTPWASRGAMMVTEGGGAASLLAVDGSAGRSVWPCEATTAGTASERRIRINRSPARMVISFGSTCSPPEHDRDLDLAAPAQHLHRYVLAVTPDPEVDGGRSEPQLAQGHLVEKRR